MGLVGVGSVSCGWAGACPKLRCVRVPRSVLRALIIFLSILFARGSIDVLIEQAFVVRGVISLVETDQVSSQEFPPC